MERFYETGKLLSDEALEKLEVIEMPKDKAALINEIIWGSIFVALFVKYVIISGSTGVLCTVIGIFVASKYLFKKIV